MRTNQDAERKMKKVKITGRIYGVDEKTGAERSRKISFVTAADTPWPEISDRAYGIGWKANKNTMWEHDDLEVEDWPPAPDPVEDEDEFNIEDWLL